MAELSVQSRGNFHALVSRLPRTQVLFLLCKRHIEETLSAVERSDLVHFLSSQFKIEYVDIVSHVVGFRCFREYDIALLNVPAENDLHIGLAVFLRKPCEHRFTNQSLIAVTDRIPALDDRAVFCDTLFQLVLLIVCSVHQIT